ncbi:hypothetical protein D3C72_1232870 [compost metagenome]
MVRRPITLGVVNELGLVGSPEVAQVMGSPVRENTPPSRFTSQAIATRRPSGVTSMKVERTVGA